MRRYGIPRLWRVGGLLTIACIFLMLGVLAVAHFSRGGFGCLVHQDGNTTYVLDLATGKMFEYRSLNPSHAGAGNNWRSIGFQR